VARKACLLTLTVTALSGCGGVAAHHPARRPAPPAARGSALAVVGQPVPAHTVTVAGSGGTLQLRAGGVLAALVRPVARHPDDVCFGVYMTGGSPAEGDLGCSVRGPGRLASVAGMLGEAHGGYLVGQLPPGATGLEMLSAGASRPVPVAVSPARIFLIVFAPAARGPVRLRASSAGGPGLQAALTLPLTLARVSAFSDRYRRPGAVFDDEIGERILGTSQAQIVRRFGPPRATLSRRPGRSCLYYDVVGEPTGWSLCFRHGTLTSASGDQRPPSGVS
jgi:hypothetical protein